MAIVLTSVSPLTGPPGTAITCVGSGFDAGTQVGCPTLVPTELVDAETVAATIPADLTGPDGGATAIAVFVMGSDGSTSTVVMFTVQFPAARLQSWTTTDAVVAEVPGFQRGGRITDDNIQTWIRSVAQEIAAEMTRRGLSMDPATWQQPGSSADPNPVDVLEMINRMGAGARLASAIGAQFSGQGEWGVSKNLAAAYARQLGALRAGDYDKFFFPGAATVEASPAFAGATACHPKFTMGQVF
jgi:hypothetical protein